MSADGILRSESTEHRWVVPIEGGYEPFTVKAIPEDGVARVSIKTGVTGPDADELRHAARALLEAAATLDGAEVENVILEFREQVK